MKQTNGRRITTRGWLGIVPGLLLPTLAAVAAVPDRAQQDLNAIRAAHTAIQSLSMTVQSREVQEDELRRMKNHAEMALEMPRIRVFFNAPDRIRLEGKRGILPVTLIVNGNSKLIRYGPIHKREDVTGNPDRKQGGLDFGLLTNQVWTDFRVISEGRRPWEDQTAIVLRLTARSSPEGSYHLVWVDEDSHRVLQIEDRTGQDELKRRQVFRQPTRTPGGAWIARRIELFNARQKFVGALELSDFVVNEGLQAKLFEN
jgi:outer membrane lipoprotein-sorting protein